MTPIHDLPTPPAAPAPRGRGRSRGAAALAALLLLLPSACGGGSTTTSGDGEVSGQVVSLLGAPVEGAEVRVLLGGEGAEARRAARRSAVPRGTAGARATTAADGSFSVPSPQGTHLLLVVLRETVLASTPFTMADFRPVRLGAVRASNPDDTDGDGLADAVEAIGWDIVLNLSARRALTTRRVHGNPTLADSDGDGMSDFEELASLTDPTLIDSDGDGLSDLDEIARYASNPTDVDSDEDAAGPEHGQLANPGLFDGNEVVLKRTSPTLADTDGDGLTDYEELTGGGLDPRRADIAAIVLEPIGDPEIALNLESTTSEATSVESFTLARDLLKRTNATTASLTLAGEFEQKASAEAGFGGDSVGFSGKASSESTWKTSFSSTGTYAFTQESERAAEQSYRDNVATNNEVRVVDGSVRVAFRVRNPSNRGLIVSDLSVLAMRVPPHAAGLRTVVGLLTPGPDFPAQVLLAPGGEFAFVAENLHLNAQTVQTLLRQPGTMYFEIANYTLSQADDRGGVRRDYAALGERIVERCAAIVVDFGGGQQVRGLVAANVDRNPDGSSQGVLLSEALTDVLGLNYTTEEYLHPLADPTTGAVTFQPTGLQVLRSLRQPGLASATANVSGLVLPFKGSSAWRMELASSTIEPVRVEGIDADLPPDFGTLRVVPGDQVTLLFLRDSDGDGISDESERFLGSAQTLTDTDRDGLLDEEELFTGWVVRFAGDEDDNYAYVVRSDPTRVDTDGDGRSDLEEFELGTDPIMEDTDLDGVSDLEDLEPLQLLTGLSSYGSPAKVHYPLNRGVDALSGLLRTYLDDARLDPVNRLTPVPGLLAGVRPTVFAGIYDTRDRFGAPNRAARLVGRSWYDSETASRRFDAPYLAAPAPEFDTGNGAYSVALWFKPSPWSFYQHEGAAVRLLGHVTGAQGPRVIIEGGTYRFEAPTTRPLDNRLKHMHYRAFARGYQFRSRMVQGYGQQLVPTLPLTPETWTHLVITIAPATEVWDVPDGVYVEATGELVSVPDFPSVDAMTAAPRDDWVGTTELHQVTVTGARVRVYQDGAEVASAFRIGPILRPNPGMYRLGEAILFHTLSDGLYDVGSMDDVRFFERALGAAEAQTLAQEAPR